jgi:glycosyltransferase involved in cell wall biosynthesis
VLTVSEYSRQEIIRWAGLQPNRVVNVGNGVDDSYNPDVPSYAPGFDYLLCVSNRKAHKNELRIVEAFTRANIDPKIRLVFTGEPSNELSALCRQLNPGHRVVFAGPVPEADLPPLYRGALALIFPSLYEGFGLPVIEAMACGTPVLTSNTTSLPEIAGNAALLVNPMSLEQIAAGIESLCRDPQLREHLRRRGFNRAKQFRWDDVAAKVKAVLDQTIRKIKHD